MMGRAFLGQLNLLKIIIIIIVLDERCNIIYLFHCTYNI